VNRDLGGGKGVAVKKERERKEKFVLMAWVPKNGRAKGPNCGRNKEGID